MLNDFWRDILTIVGFASTIAGLYYAIAQIRKTKTAARAAEEASKTALNESHYLFQRYAASNAQRFINEATIHVENRSWQEGRMRVNDLADQAGQLASLDPAWQEFADTLRRWSATLGKMTRNKSARFASNKWAEFVVRLQTKIDSCVTLFSREGKGEE